MIKIRSNPHTHTNYVDGKNTASEMAAAAYALGFTSLGFTEHARQPIDQAYALTPENEDLYINDIARLRREYAGRMRVWLGIERDRVSTADKNKFEYILAASHYMREKGEYVGVDADGASLLAFTEKHMAGDWARVIDRYFSEYAEYVEHIKPDIIAHFELIAKTNRKYHFFDEYGLSFQTPARAALRRMIKACNVMEVNTGGIARNGQPYPYPSPALLKYWRELGGEVIPASDCHRAHQLEAWFDACPGYIRAAGYDHMLTLGAGDALFERVELCFET